MKLLIPVAAGTEPSVKRQLAALGYGECPAIDGRISLTGDFFDVARLNVFLRAGERVLIELGRFPAHTFDELFEGVFSLPWEEFLSPHSAIFMDGKSFKSQLAAVKAAGGVAKKAVLRRLAERLGASVFDEKGERAVVGVSILKDVASITLDTSGDGLHKRGYRVKTYDAPLRETVAAAIVESSYFRRGKPLADVFCGSGTIPIEAAMYALDLAPGAARDFDFTRWKCVEKGTLGRARAEAADVRFRGEIPPIFAGDISERAVEVAKFHAERAGVAKYIRFSRADMRSFTAEEAYGVLISNPPYGERLGRAEELFPLYRDLAAMLRRLPDWSGYILSAYPEAERALGRCPKKRRYYNGHIPCTLYAYPGRPPRDHT